MGLTVTLNTADIEPRHDIAVPGSWRLVSGTRIHVKLTGGETGILTVTKQIDPNSWQLTWERECSPLNGETFELARMVSTISENPATADWNCRLLLVRRNAA